MKHKEELLEALKQCWLYIAAFVVILIVSPLTRGEKLEFLSLRILLLLLGVALSVWLRYRQIMNEKRNEALGYRSGYEVRRPAKPQEEEPAEEAAEEAEAQTPSAEPDATEHNTKDKEEV